MELTFSHTLTMEILCSISYCRSLDDDYDSAALELVKLLVGYGCDPLGANSRGETPLHIAVGQGYISAARYLLTLGAHLPPDLLVTLDRDQSGWSTAPMIRFLVEHRVNVLARACDGDSVLYIALRHDRTARNDLLKVVTRLVGYGCDPLEANPRGETPLHIAAERRHISAVQYFIAQGASVLTKASNGNTVLHFATGGAESRYISIDSDGCARDAC
ncbi:ankyrin repeat-containing domain protein [Boletus coccyginus]|nr:ankyrin repeat-containing domain protein [Boletus coccyginus]